MSSNSVRFKRIHVEKALGIERGSGFAVDGLSPGINIIHGPNGCGKSTMCHVAHELLWPGRLNRPTIGGEIVDGSDEWEVGIEAGFVEARRNGSVDAAPDFGPKESRKRYHLHLSDLIIDDNADFARKIADAVRGGYDLDAAAKAIGARDTVGRPNNDLEALRKAIARLDTVGSEQQAVEKQARRIDELEAKLDEARRAQEEYELLSTVRAYRDQFEECEELKRRLDAFPPIMARLRGDEEEVLKDLAAKDEQLRARRQEAEQRIREAEEQRHTANLPDDGVAQETIVRLEALKSDLQAAEQEVARQNQRTTEAKARTDDAVRVLGSHLTEAQLEALETIEQPDLTRFAEQVDSLRGREQALAAERERLTKEPEPDAPQRSRDEIRNGMRLLSDWLAIQDETPASGQTMRLAASIALIVLGVFTLIVGPVWLGVVLLLVAVLVGWDLQATRRERDMRKQRQADAERAFPAHLQAPAAWSRADVRATLEALSVQLAAQELADERSRLLEALARDEQRLQADKAALTHEREAIRQRIGIEMDVDDAWLRLVVQRICDWQSAAGELAGRSAALESERYARESLRSNLAGTLATFGYQSVETAAEAEGFINNLKRRNDAHAEAKRTIRNEQSTIRGHVEPELEATSTTRQALFERLQLSPHEQHRITEALERRKEYDDCKQTHTQTDGALQSRLVEVRDRALAFGASADELLELSQYEIDARIETADETRNLRDSLSDELGGIRQSIAAAKAGHSLTDALKAYDEALEKLSETREDNSRGIVGHALAEWVRETSVDASRPRVFHRANELFVSFTSGDLHLQLDDHATPPAFVARTASGHVRALDELSDGERIQLMTAVRLAFLEQDERRPLPLFIDEVLGTSDDDRSRVMIDATIEIARTGRQVFYFTAQLDEVGKWQARLAEADVENQVIDLAEVRRGFAGRATPLVLTPVERPRPEEPNGMTYVEYGEVLGVPGIDPLIDTVDTLHLWHVLEDADLLHRLLSENFDTWGRLRNYLDYGGSALLNDTPGTADRVHAAARVVAAACEGFRIGRGRPVNREVLLESNAVTDSFIDRVAALCTQVDGDAQAILDALERGAVARFRTASIDDLRAYFQEHGYLPDREPLTPDDLRIRVLAAATADLNAGLINTAYIDRVLSALP